jgi:membrane-associated phospholipid phosphatase
MQITNYIWNTISLSELLIPLFPTYWYLTTWNPIHLYGFLGIILTGSLVEIIKKFILPTMTRPEGAKGCDLLCKSTNDTNKPGMPSGHTAMIAFFGSYYGIQSPYFIGYVILIMMSRYFKKCHTIMQILAGLLLGLCIGFGLRYGIPRVF